MQTRSFTVYVDTPSPPPPKATPAASSSSSEATPTTPPDPTTVGTNKENVNPLTGQAWLKTDGKKRKGSILAAKTVEPVVEQTEPSPKKRKGVVPVLGSSSVASSSAAVKTTKPKATKKVGRKGKGATTRKTVRQTSPSMPKVDEENEEILRAAINSRCYELTVSPLADVSEAYLQTAEPKSDGDSDVTPTFIRETSTGPQIHDYFSPEPDVPPTKKRLPSSRAPSAEPKVFTTPERKEIYAAFTFSSPIRTSQQQNQHATRAVSVPPLIDFESPTKN